MLHKIKKFLERKYIPVDKVNESIRKAIKIETDRLKKIHGEEVSTIIDDMYTDKKIEIEEIKADMQKLIDENKKLLKRNEYLESLYYENAEIAKINSIVSQEMSTDAMRLENELTRLTGLIHGINTKAQTHYKKCQKEQYRRIEKMRRMGD